MQKHLDYIQTIKLIKLVFIGEVIGPWEAIWKRWKVSHLNRYPISQREMLHCFSGTEINLPENFTMAWCKFPLFPEYIILVTSCRLLDFPEVLHIILEVQQILRKFNRFLEIYLTFRKFDKVSRSLTDYPEV